MGYCYGQQCCIFTCFLKIKKKKNREEKQKVKAKRDISEENFFNGYIVLQRPETQTK